MNSVVVSVVILENLTAWCNTAMTRFTARLNGLLINESLHGKVCYLGQEAIR
jgi:hypothetical protein